MKSRSTFWLVRDRFGEKAVEEGGPFIDANRGGRWNVASLG